jgi:peptidoglycan/xylan/chitin deacetylase (PgdA/CDA1 family)
MIAGRVSIEELSRSLWMQDQDLVDLAAAGHVVGLHSYSHSTVLAELTPVEQEREYSLNVDHLRSVLGTDPDAMSHPCNSYTRVTLDILKRLGVGLGFQANMAQPGETNLEYPREDHANILVMMQKVGA